MLASRLLYIFVALLSVTQTLRADIILEDGESFVLENDETLIIDGSVEIPTNATLTSGDNSEIQLSHNWINAGSYVANTGSVVFNGSNNTSFVSGDNSFYQFIVDQTRADTSGKNLIFEDGSNHTALS